MSTCYICSQLKLLFVHVSLFLRLHRFALSAQYKTECVSLSDEVVSTKINLATDWVQLTPETRKG
jgi:hypothetical protein